MTIFEKLQKKLAEHAAMYGDLPDFILLTDEEYGELVGISDKNYQPKANDRTFWGVPTSVSDAIEEFTFAYTEKPINRKSELWQVGEDVDGMFVKIRNNQKEYVQPPNTFLLINGQCIGYDLRMATAKALVNLAVMNTQPPFEK